MFGSLLHVNYSVMNWFSRVKQRCVSRKLNDNEMVIYKLRSLLLPLKLFFFITTNIIIINYLCYKKFL